MVLAILTSYNIQSRLGYFVKDNTSTNDILIDYVSANLEFERISYNLYYHWLYYNSYIINQAICTFLFGKYLDAKSKI